MNWIATQTYYKVERSVCSLEQKIVRKDRLLYLYKEKVVTKHREFPIQEVWDISYRSMGGEGGILYLHTRQGVFSYMVSDNPQPFIEAYKDLAATE